MKETTTKLLQREEEYIKNLTSLKLITEITKQRVTTDKIRWLEVLEHKEHDRQVDKENNSTKDWEKYWEDHIDIPKEEQQMIEQSEDDRRQQEARREDKKNDQILLDLLLQFICQPKPIDTSDTIAGIIKLCTTISLIDQI